MRVGVVNNNDQPLRIPSARRMNATINIDPSAMPLSSITANNNPAPALPIQLGSNPNAKRMASHATDSMTMSAITFHTRSTRDDG